MASSRMWSKLMAPATNASPPTNRAVRINSVLSVWCTQGHPLGGSGEAEQGGQVGEHPPRVSDGHQQVHVPDLHAQVGVTGPRGARLGQPCCPVPDRQQHGARQPGGHRDRLVFPGPVGPVAVGLAGRIGGASGRVAPCRVIVGTAGLGRLWLRVALFLRACHGKGSFAQQADEDRSRVHNPTCYDPIVAVHARALLTGTDPGVRGFVAGDLRRPQAILDSPTLRDTLDLHRPVGLLLLAVLHFLEDDESAYEAVRHLVAGLAPGSFVALSHVTFDPLPFAVAARLTRMSAPEAGHGPFRARTRAQVARFLDGLDVVEPGLVSTVEWHPERQPPAEAPVSEAVAYCAESGHQAPHTSCAAGWSRRRPGAMVTGRRRPAARSSSAFSVRQ